MKLFKFFTSKLFLKTLGWAVIAAVIFWVSAIWTGCDPTAAMFASLIATASKTPFYPLWEVVFNWLCKEVHTAPPPCDSWVCSVCAGKEEVAV